jgi:biotin transport system substrate-specific component
MPVAQLQLMAYASLAATLTAVGAYIHIPLGPVPVVLQNLFVLLAGLLLGSRWGAISIATYLLVGAIGFPVFSGARGGIAHLLGPTGGYLVGFLAAAYLTGYISEHFRNRVAADVGAVVLGSVTIYAVGVPWLKIITGLTWGKALAIGMLPFLPGDVLKAGAAVMLARKLRPLVARPPEPAAAI